MWWHLSSPYVNFIYNVFLTHFHICISKLHLFCVNLNCTYSAWGEGQVNFLLKKHQLLAAQFQQFLQNREELFFLSLTGSQQFKCSYSPFFISIAQSHRWCTFALIMHCIFAVLSILYELNIQGMLSSHWDSLDSAKREAGRSSTISLQFCLA